MAAEYKVLKIDRLTVPSDRGGIEYNYRITFKSKGGVVDSVILEESEYTEEKVAAKVLALAQKHDKILKS